MLPKLFTASLVGAVIFSPLASGFLARPNVPREISIRQLFTLFSVSLLGGHVGCSMQEVPRTPRQRAGPQLSHIPSPPASSQGSTSSTTSPHSTPPRACRCPPPLFPQPHTYPRPPPCADSTPPSRPTTPPRYWGRVWYGTALSPGPQVEGAPARRGGRRRTSFPAPPGTRHPAPAPLAGPTHSGPAQRPNATLASLPALQPIGRGGSWTPVQLLPPVPKRGGPWTPCNQPRPSAAGHQRARWALCRMRVVICSSTAAPSAAPGLSQVGGNPKTLTLIP